MKSLSYFLLAASLLTGTGQTFAKPISTSKTYSYDTQDRHLSGFHAIEVAGSYDVYIVQSNTESVKVEADADDMDRMVTEVNNGVLKIYTKNNKGWNWSWNSGSHKRVVYVSVRNITAIALTGSGDVYFKDGIRTNNLTLKLTGSGDLYGRLDVTNLQSSIVGSGDIKISGRAENSEVSVVGSGDFTASNLATVNTVVKVRGSGDAVVNANQQLDAAVSGSGDIRYSGNVKQVSSSKFGSGSISRM
ncbi:DUF2807 domain-containing protein [Mucilaginibacter robiniae]|uniref:DUF2807 domain-containing protein n=1 Tax=Mucilaginibacter robiniae TaxID=2728022 RepID=A0A7L5E565_9SPHI|nr:head GIN domain-containing protein [Mucilaginibacter robiniae]QJD97449.1 DUF2807 domain-containing protein [Mucilaginibacter robiniae]